MKNIEHDNRKYLQQGVHRVCNIDYDSGKLVIILNDEMRP